ncbi:O-methyltransferase [Bacillus sp. FJAT-50079]|uniref:O-methyltransferase n=1 Tax=Bacillus sp. FJAT-50079 TaxID=2833577 RepID=UPI001BC996EF|nr:O-methyltransferase [Bacillus sp. FJAT-50079]MBS4209017.1 O-methyltransferase [Bacillus sp. FJAT-50079]
MNERINDYLEQLVPKRSDFFQELEQFAAEHRVPIMEPAGIEVLLQLLRIQQPKMILEIGTAIGYSALRIATALPNSKIVTIELDESRYEQAIANISRANMEGRITVLKGNALDLYEEVAQQGRFDAIFIDAAKGQYTKFFEMYCQLLTDRGCVYTDNVLFKGIVAHQQTENKRWLKIAEKIRTFNQWLMDHPDYETAIIPAGDGLAISTKKQLDEK